MSAVVGLGCPTCAGVVDLPEGQRLVRCPYCESVALLVGDEGVFTYQVPATLDQAGARAALMGFLGEGNRAFDLKRRARVKQLFLVWMPYWRVPAWVLGWRFGKRWEGSNDNRRLVPKELRVAGRRISVHPACDPGEIGVRAVDLGDASRLEPADRDALAARGMVFAPVQSRGEALDEARKLLLDQAREEAPLDQLTSERVDVVDPQLELVFFPLWVARYDYRGRVYQVVIDATDGTVRYGRAPGSALYRAFALVAGMALGTAVLVSGPLILAVCLAVLEPDEAGAFALLCLPLGVGPTLLGSAWAAYRYGGEVLHEESP